jgi:hypothetical protein
VHLLNDLGSCPGRSQLRRTRSKCIRGRHLPSTDPLGHCVDAVPLKHDQQPRKVARKSCTKLLARLTSHGINMHLGHKAARDTPLPVPAASMHLCSISTRSSCPSVRAYPGMPSMCRLCVKFVAAQPYQAHEQQLTAERASVAFRAPRVHTRVRGQHCSHQPIARCPRQSGARPR